MASNADPMAPPSTGGDASISPLRAVTIATNDLDETRRFYSGALGMTATLRVITGDQAERLSRQWGLPVRAELETMLFKHPFAPDGAILRAVKVEATEEVRRPEYDSRYAGPLGFGFPILGMTARERIALEMGYRSSAGIKGMDFPRADGSTYNVGEIHFLAPDNIMVLGVDRGEMAPVGPIDPVLGMGQIAYASCLVTDIAEFGRFLTDVLGLNRRREMVFEGGGANGGMIGLALSKERVAFEQWYSGNAVTGYLVVMRRLQYEQVAAAAPAFQGRGVAMWTFETKDLEGAVARHRAAGGVVDVSDVDGFDAGVQRSAVFHAPDGFLVELVEGKIDG